MTDEKNGSDYANLAFNPYAISSDDLTFDDDLKKGKSVDNHGFEGKMVEEINPHYEDTLEVAKKAGLTGTGRRKKENIIYEDAAITTNKKNTKNTGPRLRNSALPAPPTEDWKGISRKRSNPWKIPFAILCVLVLICIVGSALGVLSYLDDKECSCESAPITNKQTGQLNTSKSTSNAELISQLTQQLVELQKELESLKTRQTAQDKVHEILNSTIKEIDSTLNVKLKAVSSSVSLLTKDLDEFEDDLMTVNNFTQQLSSTLDNVNSTVSIKLTNVSKQLGPRGYNGSQGLQGHQGVQGVGNLTLCTVRGEVKTQSVSEHNPSLTKSQIETIERTGYKIMAATCTTEEYYGAGQTVLSITEPISGTHPYTYTCTCVGVSTLGSLAPVPDGDSKSSIKCAIKYWECPLLT